MQPKAERRWKTICKHRKRKKMLKFAWGYEITDECGYGGLEDPKICSCPMCSFKNGWEFKSDRRRMRNGKRKAIREFYETLEK